MRPAFATTLLLVLLASSPPAAAALFGTLFAGSPPATLGAREGRLAPCPDRPNCVASQATDAGHAIAPLQFRGDATAAMATLTEIIRGVPRATVVTARPDYVHAEFASAVMGFVDDVEFAFDAGGAVIHVRSAARLGHYDFGVNRRRVEMLSAAFAAASR